MSRARIALFLPAVALLLAGCAASHKDATAPTAQAPAVTAPSSSAASPAAAAATAPATDDSGLSGKWAGQYGGAFQGTFKLNWQQSGSSLTGRIKISDPATTVPIHGTVNGSAITFGTVGSTNITYSGSVSGNSMSGTYTVATANGSAGGPWSASKNP
jgi:hypothetical protein